MDQPDGSRRQGDTLVSMSSLLRSKWRSKLGYPRISPLWLWSTHLRSSCRLAWPVLSSKAFALSLVSKAGAQISNFTITWEMVRCAEWQTLPCASWMGRYVSDPHIAEEHMKVSLTTQTPSSDFTSTQRSILDLWLQVHKNLGSHPSQCACACAELNSRGHCPRLCLVVLLPHHICASHTLWEINQ